VDPCVRADEVARIAERARELNARVTHVLATHGDWDHVCGLAAFPDALATMGAATAARIRSGEAGDAIAEAAQTNGIAVAGPPRVDRTLEPGRAYTVGPFEVETIALRGHTTDGVGYRIRALDLLIVGDHLSSVEFPFATATAEYRITLAGLSALLRRDPPAVVVPGHGPAATPAGARAVAEADLAYLDALRDAVSSVGARGDDARAAGLAVPLPRTAPADLAVAHAANVEAQLDELYAGQPA
jgi:glyoxylase-like metal-dependent hydrolase (beta-lactamase superfamily II)